MKREVEVLRKQCIRDFDIDNIIGESQGIKEAMKLVNTIAKRPNTTVLIEGETGTGKEVIARAIHTRSAGFGKPFVTINCGSISKELVESELFGYERGSFTGGLSEGKKGKFEIADGGTILLDEISELLPSAQVESAEISRGKNLLPCGRKRKKEGRCAHHRRHEQEPRRGHPGGTFAAICIIDSMSPRYFCHRCGSGKKTSSRRSNFSSAGLTIPLENSLQASRRMPFMPS